MMSKQNHACRKYSFSDDVFTFEGAVSVFEDGEYAQPIRIQWEKRDLFPILKDLKGRQASGVRLCFTTNTRNLALEIGNEHENPRVDLFVDSNFVESVVCSKRMVEFKILPEGKKEIEIWLDQSKGFCLKHVIVDSSSEMRKTIVRNKKWIHYGSSISHSLEASSPSSIWTGIAARKLSLHLTNLGFHSECKCDSMIGFMIADLPADYITMKLGINLVDGDLNRRTFQPAIFGLVKSIREKKPSTPIVLISPIYSPGYEENRGGSGFNLIEMREEVKSCVNILKKYGDDQIFYTDGLEIFGEAYSGYMPDQLHPDAEGQTIMASNFIDKVFRRHLLNN